MQDKIKQKDCKRCEKILQQKKEPMLAEMAPDSLGKGDVQGKQRLKEIENRVKLLN